MTALELSGNTETTHVYRVDKLGQRCGPYSHLSFWNHTTESRHPTPWEENIELNHSLYCGFTSLKALHEWFSRADLGYCYENGYDVVKYTVANYEVNRGERQCTFPLDDVRHTREVISCLTQTT